MIRYIHRPTPTPEPSTATRARKSKIERFWERQTEIDTVKGRGFCTQFEQEIQRMIYMPGFDDDTS